MTPNHSIPLLFGHICWIGTLILDEEVGRRVAFHKEGSLIYTHSDHSYTMTHNFCVHLKKKTNYRILVFMNCKRWVKMCNLYKKKLIHNLSVNKHLYASVMNWLILPYKWGTISSKSLASFVEFLLFCFTQYMKHLSMCSLTLVFIQYFVGFAELYQTPGEPFSCVIAVRLFLNSWIDSSPHPSNCSRVIVHD